ncbi:MAG: hypothetical protein Q8S19_10495 [Bacillota bacterium]|nr:hypothetical protein [Bacillota bacterium]
MPMCASFDAYLMFVSNDMENAGDGPSLAKASQEIGLRDLYAEVKKTPKGHKV